MSASDSPDARDPAPDHSSYLPHSGDTRWRTAAPGNVTAAAHGQRAADYLHGCNNDRGPRYPRIGTPISAVAFDLTDPIKAKSGLLGTRVARTNQDRFSTGYGSTKQIRFNVLLHAMLVITQRW